MVKRSGHRWGRLPAVAGIATALLILSARDPEGALPARGARRPNILLVSIDTLRADHLGCYGYPKPTSPFLDRLARRGVLFTKAFSSSSWTLPAHMSMFTSMYPPHHGVETFESTLPKSVVTLPQILRRSGYATAGFVTHMFVSSRYGFDRGFDRFVEIQPDGGVPASRVVDAALEWAEGAPKQPWFLFTHFYDAHLDYAPPLETARLFDPEASDLSIGTHEFLAPHIKGLSPKYERISPELLPRITALYDAQIRYVDGELERLFLALSRRGMLDDTIVIVTSDHGEELDDHGSMEGHQWTLYDEVIRIPLIIRFPGGEHAGTRVDSVVERIDVAPTMLARLGLPIPAEFDGRDLFGDSRGEERIALSEIKRFSFKWAARTERFKLIYTADSGLSPFGFPTHQETELYDLLEDPKEQRNIAGREPQEVARLLGRLQHWSREPVRKAPAVNVSRGEVERLRSLGYVNR